MKRINLTSCVLFTLFALFPLSSWAADGIKVLKSGIKHFGKTVPRCFAAILGISLGFALYTVPAYAGGGNVLPPKAKPKGYSLSEIAEATAIFNTGVRSKATEPSVPFQILYVPTDDPSNTFFQVRPGTMLYVPIVYVDDSEPIIGDFPTDVTDHAAVVYYYYAHEQLGTEYIEVEVDGKVTQLGPKYVVGVETPPLPDGGGH